MKFWDAVNASSSASVRRERWKEGVRLCMVKAEGRSGYEDKAKLVDPSQPNIPTMTPIASHTWGDDWIPV